MNSAKSAGTSSGQIEAVEQSRPGVTLHYKSSSVSQRAVGYGGTLTLDCNVTDLDLLEQVEQKFKEGLRIYTVEDFRGEILKVAREEIHRLTSELAQERQKNERLNAEKEQLATEVKEYKDMFSQLTNSLRGT